MVKSTNCWWFSEVGKNMVVVELEDDAFIFDEGFFTFYCLYARKRKSYD
jgi:hypothetical protein